MVPDYRERDDITVVGLAHPFNVNKGGVDGPAVWRRFAPHMDQIANRLGTHVLGVCEAVDQKAGDFVCSPAVEVSAATDLHDDLLARVLKGGCFAVFNVNLANSDIAEEIRRTCQYIYGSWADENRSRLRDRFDFEYYDERFDRATLTGEMDIWVPVFQARPASSSCHPESGKSVILRDR